MKNKLFTILLCTIIVLSLTSCNDKEEKENIQYEQNDKDLYKCLENELGGYLVTEKDSLVEIPLTDIKTTDLEKIAYYKGFYASNNKDNMYLMVFPKDGTYEFDVMKDFDNYFNQKFTIYQKFETYYTPTIYYHNKDNSIELTDLTDKCISKNNQDTPKSIKTETIKKLNSTNKIIIKSGNIQLGTIEDPNKIAEVLSAITASRKYGKICLSDGHAFDFDMYKDNKLLDTINVWHDGKRLLPKSIKGCYYSTNIDLRKIIEEETDFIFYNIYDFSDSCNTKKELIYENDNYKYYLNCQKSKQVTIKFLIENKTLNLKYALENNYISADTVANDYPDVLIKESKKK